MSCKVCSGKLVVGQAVQDSATGEQFCDEQCANIDWQAPESNTPAIENPFRKILGRTNFEADWRYLFEQLFDYTDKSFEISQHKDNLDAWAVDKKQLGAIATLIGKAVKKFENSLSVVGGNNVTQHIEAFAWSMVKYIDATIAKKQAVSYSDTSRKALIDAIIAAVDIDKSERLPDNTFVIASLEIIWDKGEYIPNKDNGRGLGYALEKYATEVVSGRINTRKFQREVYDSIRRLGYILDNAWRNSQSRERKQRFDDRKKRFKKRRGGRGRGDAATTSSEDEKERQQTASGPPTESPPVTPGPGPVPDPWEEYVDDDDGSVYYYNPETKETVWTRPTVQSAAISVPSAPPMSRTTEFVTEKPNSLPTDWHAAYSPDVRAYYFFNPTISVVSWNPPIGGGWGRKKMAKTIPQKLKKLGLTTLVGAVKAAGLAETLSGGNWTVFAPTNTALKIAGAGNLDIETLTAVLLNHVIRDKRIEAGDLRMGKNTVTAAGGGQLIVERTDDAVVINGTAYVIKANVRASNGVIHVIDRVLLP